MHTILSAGYWNGEAIVPDELLDMEPNTKLIVAVRVDNGSAEAEREEWYRFVSQNLARAYGNDEPEYTEADIKVLNPEYEANRQ